MTCVHAVSRRWVKDIRTKMTYGATFAPSKAGTFVRCSRARRLGAVALLLLGGPRGDLICERDCTVATPQWELMGLQS